METKKIILPSGIEAELKPYVEAGVILDAQKAADKEKFLFEALVVSLGGSTANVYAGIRKLRIKDYKALDAECTKLVFDEDEGK